VHEAAQWDWVRSVLLPSPPAEHYRVKRLDRLDPPPPLLEARRSDTINRVVAPPLEVTSRYEPDLDGKTPRTPLPERWTDRYRAGPADQPPSPGSIRTPR